MFRTLLVVVSLTAFISAQSGDGEAEAMRRKRAIIQGAEQADGGKGGITKDGEGKVTEEMLAKMTPEERLNHNIRHGAAQYCTFVATPKPAKLMPGQSGMVVVTAVLRGSAVLPAPAPLEVISTAHQGDVSLGAPAFRPAGMGSGELAKGYAGRPVYDNWAIFEVPVTMSADAVIGKKQPISLEMRFDLFDGSSAQPIGRFLDRASSEIEVGQSVDPMIAGGVPTAQPVAGGSTTGHVSDDRADHGQKHEVKTEPMRAVGAAETLPVVTPADAKPDSKSSTPTSPLVVEEGGLPMPLLLGGGGALLLLAVMILARRK